MQERAAALGAVVLIGLATAAGLAAQAAGPTAQHQELAYFVGRWAGEGEMKAGPFGPGGKMTTKDTCDWFEGRYSVVCRTEGTGPMGATKSIGIMGYSAEEKVYTYYGVDNTPMTMASVPRGRKDGSTWTFTDESMMGGQKVKSRFIITALSPDAYAFKWEAEGPGGTWATIMEGKSTRVK
jgi:hypothetical protein